jgi:hypothetical protein
MLSKLEAEYPTCKGLLQLLLVVEDITLASLVAKATFISETMKLIYIS